MLSLRGIFQHVAKCSMFFLEMNILRANCSMFILRNKHREICCMFYSLRIVRTETLHTTSPRAQSHEKPYAIAPPSRCRRARPSRRAHLLCQPTQRRRATPLTAAATPDLCCRCARPSAARIAAVPPRRHNHVAAALVRRAARRRARPS